MTSVGKLWLEIFSSQFQLRVDQNAFALLPEFFDGVARDEWMESLILGCSRAVLRMCLEKLERVWWKNDSWESQRFQERKRLQLALVSNVWIRFQIDKQCLNRCLLQDRRSHSTCRIASSYSRMPENCQRLALVVCVCLLRHSRYCCWVVQEAETLLCIRLNGRSNRLEPWKYQREGLDCYPNLAADDSCKLVCNLTRSFLLDNCKARGVDCKFSLIND